MKIPYIAFNSLNQLLKLQSGYSYKLSRQTRYNYRTGGVPPDRFAALIFCLLANNVDQTLISRTLDYAGCDNAIDTTLALLLEKPRFLHIF